MENIDTTRWFVLDEADRLIQGDHFHELEMLFERLSMRKSIPYPQGISTYSHVLWGTLIFIYFFNTESPKRQLLLFSATLIDKSIAIKRPKTGVEPTSVGIFLTAIVS